MATNSSKKVSVNEDNKTTDEHGVRRTTLGEVEIPSYGEVPVNKLGLLGIQSVHLHTSHLGCGQVSSFAAQVVEYLTSAHFYRRLGGNPASGSRSSSAEDQSRH